MGSKQVVASSGVGSLRQALRSGPFVGALVVSTCFSVVSIWRGTVVFNGTRYGTLFDDAMISMRYARNLAEGNGLVWNAGEPGVEGYTNFGWTVVMAGLHAIGLPDHVIPLVVAAVGLVTLVGGLFLTWALTMELTGGSRSTANVAAWIAALCYPLVFWTLRGMEVGLLGLVLLASCLVVARASNRSSPSSLFWLVPLFVVGPLIRTDAIVPLGVCAFYATCLAPREARLRVALVSFGSLLGVVAAHTGLRLWWYGEPLPNTYYLKVEGVSLSTRLNRGVTSLLVRVLSGLWLPIVLAFAYFGGRWHRLRTVASLPFAMVLSVAAYSTYVGGDAWEWMPYANRYLATSLPLLAVATAMGIAELAHADQARRRRWLVGLLVVGGVSWTLITVGVVDGSAIQTTTWELEYTRDGVALAVMTLAVVLVAARGLGDSVRRRTIVVGLAIAAIAATSLSGLKSWGSDGGLHVADDKEMTAIGLALRDGLPPETSIAVTWAGSLPYSSELPAIDLLGKSDPIIAHGPSDESAFLPGHSKWDYRYSVGELQPDVVLGVRSSEAPLLEELGYRELTPRVWVGPAVDDEMADFISTVVANADGPLGP